jgi:cytochrome c-type biogenesis protein CcmH
MRSLLLALTLLAAVLTPGGAPLAVQPDEILDDPVLEARARELSKEIRCLVCQNESIDSSNADLARELRLLVRERLTAGDSDQEALDFLVARYGDFVLLRPPFKPATYVLWFGPALVLLAAEAAPLTAEESARLDRLLAESGADGGPEQGRAP